MPEFFAKHHTYRLIFNREFEQWMLKQGIESKKTSQLRTMKSKLASFWRRELKLRFNIWKDNVRARMSSLRVINRLATKARYFETSRAFTKWTSFVNEQNFHVRMHGLAVLTSLK